MKRKNKIPKKVCVVTMDMTHFTTITKEGSREPTKWEVLRVAFFRLLYFRSGSGSFRKLLTSLWMRFKAASWKAGQVTPLNEGNTTPESSLSVNDTE